MYSDATTNTATMVTPISIRQRSILNAKLPDEKECKIIDDELSERTGTEIEAAWQRLCGYLLMDACKTLACRYIRKKDQVFDKRKAKEWLQGKETVVTFEEMCLTLGLDADRTRKAVEDYAEQPVGNPINRTVMGVLNNEDK